MKIVLPRIIHGNRGDLLSRWCLLHALEAFEKNDVTVFADTPEDIPALAFRFVPYGQFFNLLPNPAGWQALRKADVAFWSVGLDVQDDSSLAKLLYLDIAFTFYRILGHRIWCLFQGAGPLNTHTGRRIAKRVLRKVDVFVARDPATYRLVKDLSPKTRCLLAHDAIFLPGINSAHHKNHLDAEERPLEGVAIPRDRTHVGFNIRQWFHFNSSILPYEFQQRQYRRRSVESMRSLLSAAKQAVHILRQEYDIRVLLISAYQSGKVPWEDDLPWLGEIKDSFSADPDVVLLENPMPLTEYVRLISQLDLMIGMRLHCCLIALRCGVPAININYTLKGRDILQHLGLSERVVELSDFLKSPKVIFPQVEALLHDPESERISIKFVVDKAIEENNRILKSLIRESEEHGLRPYVGEQDLQLVQGTSMTSGGCE